MLFCALAVLLSEHARVQTSANDWIECPLNQSNAGATIPGVAAKLEWFATLKDNSVTWEVSSRQPGGKHWFLVETDVTPTPPAPLYGAGNGVYDTVTVKSSKGGSGNQARATATLGRNGSIVASAVSNITTFP